jgi:hypothetical protein
MIVIYLEFMASFRLEVETNPLDFDWAEYCYDK